jgi:hypothetical protein
VESICSEIRLNVGHSGITFVSFGALGKALENLVERLICTPGRTHNRTLDWNLPSGTSFSSLTMLYSRLAIFSRRGLPALERAWTVSVKLVQDMALLGAHDFEVTLGALLYGMLSDRLISLEDVLVEHDETVAVLAATMDLLGSKQPNPRFYACIERATLSSRKELHAALCRVLDEVRKVELAKTQGS